MGQKLDQGIRFDVEQRNKDVGLTIESANSLPDIPEWLGFHKNSISKPGWAKKI